MKLINKFTLWYLCIALTCTVVGTAITFYSVKNKIEESAIDRLATINQIAVDQMQSGRLFDSSVLGRKIAVREISALPARHLDFIKSESSYPHSLKSEYRITVNSYASIRNKNYCITSYGYVIKGDHLLSGLEATIFWKWLLILSLIAISARLVSRIILSPFKKTLKAMELFNLKQKERIQLPLTNTREFREMNNFVKAMTDKAVDEYIALKEFTENASHELQTPVAVMGMKLELLAESSITDEQALLITDIQGSLEKLSRINSSLILLTRLENQEYATKEPLRFCRLINETLDSYKELMQMKSISLITKISSGVYVQLHPILGNLLLNNLVSNAIRHNSGEGSIEVELDHRGFVIKNSGPEPLVPTTELFQRFKKSNQSSDSIGIGLAIVKQICDIHQFDIKYRFNQGYHIIQILFPEANAPIKVSSAPPGPELNFKTQPQPAL